MLHLANFIVGSVGEMGIVGFGIRVAVGAAPGAQRSEAERVYLCSFSYGASKQRALHEASTGPVDEGADRTVLRSVHISAC